MYQSRGATCALGRAVKDHSQVQQSRRTLNRSGIWSGFRERNSEKLSQSGIWSEFFAVDCFIPPPKRYCNQKRLIPTKGMSQARN